MSLTMGVSSAAKSTIRGKVIALFLNYCLVSPHNTPHARARRVILVKYGIVMSVASALISVGEVVHSYLLVRRSLTHRFAQRSRSELIPTCDPDRALSCFCDPSPVKITKRHLSIALLILGIFCFFEHLHQIL